LFGEDFSGDVTEVHLGGTQVSDAGLAHLRGLTRLWWLSLDNAQVSDAGVDELKKALPNTGVRTARRLPDSRHSRRVRRWSPNATSR
jgi:hypothetical protein